MGKFDNFTKEELITLIQTQESEINNKEYGLVWDKEKEPEQVVLDCENNLPILKRVKEKEIETDDSDDNILIEGDNYHALSVLNYTHKGKIDIIYIDPPYNTGKANEWKYNDKYVDENDTYRHSKWLNFMEKRLKLAKNVLKENGVIFISIDDNELAQLKLLCDKIFKDNFIANIIWQKKFSPQNDATYFSNMHDYILVFAKRKKKNKKDFLGWERNLLKRNENSSYKNIDNDIRGLWTSGDLTAEGPTENCIYPIESPTGKIHYPPAGKRWVFNKDSYIILKNQNKIWFGKDGNSYPRLKRFLSEVQDGYVPNTIWFYNEVGHTQDAKQEFNNFFQREIDFEYPKPSKLIKRIIKIGGSKDSIILDFFAGTGTTGQSVLELNKEDGGNRKFILCTNNENNICEKITFQRIYKTINGYKFKGKDKTILFEKKITFSDFTKSFNALLEEINTIIEENKDKYDKIEKNFEDNIIKIVGIKNIDSFKEGSGGNLQYFKTDLIPVGKIDKINDKQRHELTEKAGQMIAIKENTIKELECNNWYQIFESRNKTRKTAIYFREDMNKFEELIKKIKDAKTVLYIFSYGRIDKKLFKYLGKNIAIEDIPEPILEIYKEINLTNKNN